MTFLWQLRKPKIVYVPGVWDLLHAGHLNLLWRARQMADVLVVGVVSDAGCKAYKQQYPVERQDMRFTNVRNLGFVDVVDLQVTTDPTPQLEKFRPQVLVHGDDWKKLLRGNESMERLGVKLVLLPYTKGVSTTQLRATNLQAVRV